MSEQTPNSLSSKDTVDIINAVKNPLGYFTLALLIANGILVYLASKATGTDFTVLLIGIIVLTFFLVIIIGILLLRQGTTQQIEIVGDKKITNFKYEVFLSMPMASLDGKEYAVLRQFGLDITEYLRQQCKMDTVKFVAEFIKSPDDFDPNDSAVLSDLDDIKNSRYFVMVYPEKIVSSVLVEAGIALSLGKSCRYFVKKRENLPYLLTQSEQAFKNVRIYEYADLDDIQKVLIDKRCFDEK